MTADLIHHTLCGDVGKGTCVEVGHVCETLSRGHLIKMPEPN